MFAPIHKYPCGDRLKMKIKFMLLRLRNYAKISFCHTYLADEDDRKTYHPFEHFRSNQKSKKKNVK